MRGRRADRRGTGTQGLERILSGVRTRWRLRRTVSGMVWVLLAALAAVVLTGVGLEAARFSPGAVLGFRLTAWSVVIGLAIWRVVLPWFKQVDDEQVALYLEEHEPSLQAAILGAVEAERARKDGTPLSPGILDGLVRKAVEKARRIENGKNIDQPALVKSSGVLAFVSVFALGLLLFGPASVQRGATSLLPTASAADLNPYSIAVEPGDATVARGSDQFVRARLQGFGAEDVSLFRRDRELDVLQQLTMIPTGNPGEFELLLLGLEDGLDYFIESDGVRSPTYTIEVVDLPYVETMSHEYRWPAYTGIPVETVENAGDIAVLPGTRVRVVVNSTVPTPSGRLIIDDQEPIGLTVDEEGRVVGEFVVRDRGYYRIELGLSDGSFVAASPEYRIDLLSDRAPTIAIEEPGRDTDVSAIEEVYIEARATDDYGIGDLRLVYSVNGAEEDTVDLYDASGAPLEEVVAGHTLFMEDFDLEDGDLVSFYAITSDEQSTGTPIASDIYFLQVRPFRRDYREAPPQEGGPPQGGEQQQQAEPGLSELQRQVIAATFNLNRDRDNYTDEEFAESTRSVALAQGRVREQVGTLTERMTNRGLSRADEQFRMIAEMLPEATAAMDTARMLLDSLQTQPALQPEQRALRVLLKAEETYERMVQLQQQQQQGGGGQQNQGANADDLADLFELELDQLENQYETVQRGERQEANQQVDELLEELESLARRQQQEAERQQARGQQNQQSSAGGGASAQSQRELADQAEEAARQLEQLARDESDPELAEAARDLQEAADAMRRAAANGDNSGAAEAQRALEQLDEAERRLRDNRESRIEQDTQAALEQARSLRQQQEDIQQRLGNLGADGQSRREEVREISEEKGEMAADAAALENQLRELAAEARQRDPETSRQLAEAADFMNDDAGLANRIQYSRGVVEQRDPEFARIFEESIRDGLEELEGMLEEAAGAASRAAQEQGLERALDEAQDLQRGAESLARRLGQRTGQEPGQQGEPGQQSGEPGQQGEPGEQQGQNQQGQQGEGQQGQNQQGQQQQGQNQQGQNEQQGQGQQQGEQGGQGRAGAPTDAQGTPRGERDFSGSSMSGGVPQPLTDAERRQYRREFEQRLQEARELRGTLQEEGRTDEVRDLGEAIEALEALADPSVFEDIPQVALLQQSLRESLGRLEFRLRREVEGEQSDRAALTGSGEIPTDFRRLVEEYYRALARGNGGGN